MSTMSALAVRLLAVRILKGATSAGDAVYDSALDPISLLTDGEDQPIIIVSSEDETGILNSRKINSGERSATLCLELAVGRIGSIKVADGGEVETFEFNPTNDVSEATLSILERQISLRLFGQVGAIPDLFRMFCPKVEKATVKRGVPTENGAKFAARLIEITFQPLEDPEFGVDLPAVWNQFLDYINVHDGPELRNLLHAALTGGAIADENRAQIAAGLTQSEANALRLDGI